MFDKIMEHYQEQENNQQAPKLSMHQYFVMLGRKDVEMEILASQNSELRKQVKDLKNRNQELYDENITLGGKTSHESK